MLNAFLHDVESTWIHVEPKKGGYSSGQMCVLWSTCIYNRRGQYLDQRGFFSLRKGRREEIKRGKRSLCVFIE